MHFPMRTYTRLFNSTLWRSSLKAPTIKVEHSIVDLSVTNLYAASIYAHCFAIVGSFAYSCRIENLLKISALPSFVPTASGILQEATVLTMENTNGGSPCLIVSPIYKRLVRLLAGEHRRRAHCKQRFLGEWARYTQRLPLS